MEYSINEAQKMHAEEAKIAVGKEEAEITTTNTDSTESALAEVPTPAGKLHYAEFVEEPQEELPLAEIVDQIQDVVDPASDVTKQWIDSITPLLSQGGKPVALILALGAISIPLAMTGNAALACILAGGAVAVAIIVAVRSKNI